MRSRCFPRWEARLGWKLCCGSSWPGAPTSHRALSHQPRGHGAAGVWVPAGLLGAAPSGKPPVPARPSRGGAPGSAGAPCQDSGIQPHQLHRERPWRQEGRLGMAFCAGSPATGPRGTEDSQVSSPRCLCGTSTSAGADVRPAVGTGPAPGRLPGPAGCRDTTSDRAPTPAWELQEKKGPGCPQQC